MQAKATVPEEESPSMLWGLDPVFSAFARLYVRDILEMVESTQVPGNFHNVPQTIYHIFTSNGQQVTSVGNIFFPTTLLIIFFLLKKIDVEMLSSLACKHAWQNKYGGRLRPNTLQTPPQINLCCNNSQVC